MISEAPRTHRIVRELVKCSNGSTPQVRGSSRLEKDVRVERLQEWRGQTWTDGWTLWLGLQCAGLAGNAAIHTCYQTLTIVSASAVTAERVQ